MKATRLCSVDDCERKYHAHGFCSSHHRRWAATGDPGPAQFEVKASTTRPCREHDCDRPVGLKGARGWCSMHYVRWRIQGDPQKLGYTRGTERSAQMPHGADHHQWRGGVAAYDGVHQRLVLERGKAALYPCVRCGGPARDWAYNHADPNALIGNRGYPYSLDTNCYDPMCRSCHRLFDIAQRGLTGGCDGPD